MAPHTKFADAEAERATVKLTLDTLEVLLAQNPATPLDEATANDSLELAKVTQQQLMDNQRSLTTYAPNEAALEQYKLEFSAQLTRAIRCTSGFRGIVMKFPPTSSPPASSSTATSNHPPSHVDIRLPRIQIPMFSGNLEEWIYFRDLFEKSIGNNNSISKAQKLTYLKSYLTGEASRHVTTLMISDANYDVAWTTLTNRYQNERELLFSILRRLMDQPIHATASALNLRNLIDTTHGCIRSLEVIRVPVEHWDAVLVFTLFNKMDQMSRELWEQGLPDSNIPTLKNLTDFLEQRARALAAGSTSLPTQKRQEKNRAVGSHHSQPQSVKCPICQQTHHLFRCTKFKDLTVTQMKEIIKKNSLCYNCFGSGHGVGGCKNPHSCRKCGKRHHTMIHEEHQSAASVEAVNSVASHHAAQIDDVHSGILATARVRVLDKNGQSYYARALLDEGSPVSFIGEAFARKLSLSLLPSSTEVNGIGGASAGMFRFW